MFWENISLLVVLLYLLLAILPWAVGLYLYGFPYHTLQVSSSWLLVIIYIELIVKFSEVDTAPPWEICKWYI